jgi:hypothetical protein
MQENSNQLAAALPVEKVQPPQPLNPWFSTKGQLLNVLASYAVARLYIDVMIGSTVFGISYHLLGSWKYLIFTLAFLAWGEAVFLLREKAGAPRPAKAIRIEAAFWAICAIGISLAFGLNLGNAAEGWAALFWHGFAVYWAVCRAGLLTEGSSGPFFAWDSLYAILILPFSEFFLRIRTLWQALCSAAAHRKKWDSKTLWVTVLCVAVAVPVFCCAVSLLMQADSGFAGLLSGFRFDFRLSSEAENELIWFALSLPVGAFLYGLIGGCARRAAPPVKPQPAREDAEHLRFAPPLAGTLILAAFCLLYLLFFVVQARYLFGAFAGQLPAGFTVAEYARQGFYELCMILVLNFGILTVLARSCALPVRKCGAVLGLCIALMGSCLLFAATAFSKLMLYIHCFGFTPRRLLSSWAVIVFAAAGILALSTLIKPHAAIRKLVWFAAASFLVLCFIW